MQEVKRSLEYSQREVDELKATLKTITIDAVKPLQSNIDTLQHWLAKVEYLENQSRRNNIVIDGIPESSDESWTPKRNLEKSNNGEHKRPRSMIVKLCMYKNRQAILSKANHVKGTNIYVNED